MVQAMACYLTREAEAVSESQWQLNQPRNQVEYCVRYVEDLLEENLTERGTNVWRNGQNQYGNKGCCAVGVQHVIEAEELF